MTYEDLWVRNRIEDLIQEGRATPVASKHPMGEKNGVGKEYNLGNNIHIICWRDGGTTVARCTPYDTLEQLQVMGGTDRAIRILEGMAH